MSAEASGARRPVPRWVGVAALLVGLVVNELSLEATVVPDGEIGSTPLRTLILALDVAAAGFGLWVLLRRPRSRVPWNKLAVAVAAAFLAWFLSFTVLDTLLPGLLGGSGVRYFDLRARYRADPDLVMVPRRTGHEELFQFRGDLHDPDDDIPDPAIEYRASYNESGFRTNSSEPPFDAVVIGDSFVEFGEGDSTTVSESLATATGLSTYNLGRGWYGPHQYVELLRRHGLERDPDFALVFFFEGNDAEDALEYEEWRNGGSYYHFDRAQGPLLERFGTATFDLISFLQWEAARRLGFRQWLADALGHREPLVVRNTGRVEVAGESVGMKFGYWPFGGAESVDAILDTPRWRAARRALERFRDTATGNGITPIVAFLPTKATTYAGQIEDLPGRYSGRAPAGSGGEVPVRARALAAVAGELGIPFVDLTEGFRASASERPLLFYPQDTHWTVRGRRVAAGAVAAFMRDRWPEAVPRGGPAGTRNP